MVGQLQPPLHLSPSSHLRVIAKGLIASQGFTHGSYLHGTTDPPTPPSCPAPTPSLHSFSSLSSSTSSPRLFTTFFNQPSLHPSLSQPMIAGKWASHFPRFYTEGSMLMIATHRSDSLAITFLSIAVIKSTG